MNPQGILQNLNTTYYNCLKQDNNETSLYKLAENSFFNWRYAPIKAPRKYLTVLIAQPGSEKIHMFEYLEYCVAYIYTFKSALKGYKPRDEISFKLSKIEATIEGLKDFLRLLHQYLSKEPSITVVTIPTLHNLLKEHNFSKQSLTALLRDAYPTQFKANTSPSLKLASESDANSELELVAVSPKALGLS